MFMTLDQIVCDPDYPECSRLVGTSGTSELSQIADIKGMVSPQSMHVNCWNFKCITSLFNKKLQRNPFNTVHVMCAEIVCLKKDDRKV